MMTKSNVPWAHGHGHGHGLSTENQTIVPRPEESVSGQDRKPRNYSELGGGMGTDLGIHI